MRKHILYITLLATLVGCTPNEAEFKSEVPVSKPIEIAGETIKDPTEKTSELPTELNLNIQFYPQAPFANWDMPYQEACEEASLILAHNYVTNTTMNIEEFDQAIVDMVEWQKGYFGSHKDLTIAETADMATKYLGYSNWKIIENPTPEQIREELGQGNPIVAPSAGRHLGNPFFSNEGPIYHMLVIRGYEKGKFITNDVGTKRGENFTYNEATFMNALRDWVDGSKESPDLMLHGQQVVLVLQFDE